MKKHHNSDAVKIFGFALFVCMIIASDFVRAQSPSADTNSAIPHLDITSVRELNKLLQLKVVS
jgi:hypothetical protein